jgi:hypothetical protein
MGLPSKVSQLDRHFSIVIAHPLGNVGHFDLRATRLHGSLRLRRQRNVPNSVFIASFPQPSQDQRSSHQAAPAIVHKPVIRRRLVGADGRNLFIETKLIAQPLLIRRNFAAERAARSNQQDGQTSRASAGRGSDVTLVAVAAALTSA